jgi:threonine/homoserine/homoserine lactone efflux protein
VTSRYHIDIPASNPILFQEKSNFMPLSNIILFFTTAVVMICTPGPDIIYVSTRGIAQGRSVGLLSTFGICIGYIVHTALAVLGLSALLQASTTAFQVIRYAGAGYLIYLGIRTLLSKEAMIPTSPEAIPVERGKIVWQGIVTSILNPKGIFFFMAFLPQFVDAQIGKVPLQMLVYGLAFTTLCLLIYGMIGYFAGGLGERLSRQPQVADLMKWFSGSVLIGLGLRMAIPERK